jgi:superfamily I DNA/RNA helicase
LVRRSRGAEADALLPDLIKVMDLQREQLARSLGEGHRVMHGVAGAGKTLILVYRCLHLARLMSRPILVLCYNRPLAARLQQLVYEKGIGDKVQVYNFHRWCREQLMTYSETLPPEGAGFFEELVQRLISAVDAGRVPAGQYGAVMLDEGHDFQPEWLKLTAQMVDPSTNSLLVLYDDAQSIYTRSRGKFSFASVGIQARGRTTILKLNYRNTDEVLKTATAFAQEVLTEADAEEDGIPLLAPTSAGRRGPPPLLLELPNFSAETRYVAERLQTLHDKGRNWGDMAIVYRSNFIGDKIRKTLQENRIPCETLTGQKYAAGKTQDTVKLVTMHSSKGLEFPVVFVAGLGYLPSKNQDEKEEARLLYVAMTRAMDELILTGHQNSGFVERMRAVVG